MTINRHGGIINKPTQNRVYTISQSTKRQTKGPVYPVVSFPMTKRVIVCHALCWQIYEP